METWFKTISERELKTWIKMMNSPFNQFMNSENDNKNILLAKEELRRRRRKWQDQITYIYLSYYFQFIYIYNL